MHLVQFSRRAIVGALLAGTGCLAIGKAPVPTLTVDHAKGRAEVPARPARIVVYDLGALDTLYTLGVPVAGGPKAEMPSWLQDYAARHTVVGSLFQPDYDALSKIRPDLIIVGGRTSAKYDVLSKIAPTLDLSVKGTQMLQDIERNITTLALLTGREQRGQALVAQIRQDIAELREAASQAAPGVLLMAINERIAPQAPGSRFGFLFDVFGTRSAITAKDMPARGTPYTFDDVAHLDPEWIYVIDRNTATGSAAGGGEIIPSEKVFDNPQVKGTRAGRQGQVVFLDPKGWYLMGSTGPTALLGNVAQLKQAYAAARR